MAIKPKQTGARKAGATSTTGRSPARAPTRKAPPVKTAPASKAPVKKVPVKSAPVKKAPVKKAPTRGSVVAKAAEVRLFQWGASADKRKRDPALQPYQGPLPSVRLSPMLDALRAIAQDPAVRSCGLWGLLTDDFNQRTGMSGSDLLAVIQANPGFDLYYCSAHPDLEAVYHNPWRSPQVTHPDFVAVSREFLKAAGLSDTPIDSISHSALFATGHLMVASPDLWRRYLDFVENVFARAQGALSPAAKARLFNEKPIPGRLTYLELIVARLVSVFLMLKGASFKAFKIPLATQEKGLNSHLRLLREMKDFGLQHQSKWHLTAWFNYRGLYLAHVMGRAWILKHINGVTPTTLHLALPVAEVVNPYLKSNQA